MIPALQRRCRLITEFEASLVYKGSSKVAKGSSRIARATQWNPVSKTTNNTQKGTTCAISTKDVAVSILKRTQSMFHYFHSQSTLVANSNSYRFFKSDAWESKAAQWRVRRPALVRTAQKQTLGYMLQRQNLNILTRYSELFTFVLLPLKQNQKGVWRCVGVCVHAHFTLLEANPGLPSLVLSKCSDSDAFFLLTKFHFTYSVWMFCLHVYIVPHACLGWLGASM